MSVITEIVEEFKFNLGFRKSLMSGQKALDAKAPRAGDMAPDFTLYDIDGKDSVTLSDFHGKKPVAQVFGSYTWPPYVKGTVGLQEIYKQYHDEVQFLSIYIREAHPKDGWWLGNKWTKKLIGAIFTDKASFEHNDPQTIEERRVVAGVCEMALQYGIKTYVDEMDDYVNHAYAGWPTRLYLVGLDGKIIYAGGQGPIGMKPKELKDAIDDYLKELA